MNRLIFLSLILNFFVCSLLSSQEVVEGTSFVKPTVIYNNTTGSPAAILDNETVLSCNFIRLDGDNKNTPIINTETNADDAHRYFYSQYARTQSSNLVIGGKYHTSGGDVIYEAMRFSNEGALLKTSTIFQAEIERGAILNYPIFSKSKYSTAFSFIFIRHKDFLPYLVVIDSTGEKKWDEYYDLKYKGEQVDLKNVELLQTAVNNEGTMVYLLAKIFEKSFGKKTNPRKKYEVVLFRKEKNQIASEGIAVGRQDYRLGSSYFEFDEEDNLLFFENIFENNEDAKNSIAIFIKFDKQGKILSKSEKELGLIGFLNSDTSPTEGTSAHFFKRSDGSVVFCLGINNNIINQQTPALPRVMILPIMPTFAYTPFYSFIENTYLDSYRSSSLYLFILTSDFNFKSFKTIPKRQNITKKEHLGYEAFMIKDDIYFIYNEDVKDLSKDINLPKLAKEKVLKNKSKSTIVLTKLDTNNNLSRKALSLGNSTLLTQSIIKSKNIIYFLDSKSNAFRVNLLKFDSID